MPINDCPEFLKPRLRLFLSADIVGSTALKQSRLGAFADGDAKATSGWFSVIQGFYMEARQLFLGEWERDTREHAAHPEYFGARPSIWKTIGDEVLFVKDITDHRQVSFTIKCWIEAVQKMRAALKDQHHSLDVKSTAWLAGFPLKDKEVVINSELDNLEEVEDYYKESGKILNKYYSGDTAGISLDFIGPSIDIGFRLSQHSSARRFVIGVDIPYILSLTNPGGNTTEEWKIFYSGSVPLKGVFGGITYPIFWIDMDKPESLASFEDNLSNLSAPSRDNIRKYCEAFYKEYQAYTFRPFVWSEREQQIGDMPSWYEDSHANLVKNFVDTPSDDPTTGADAAAEETAPPSDIESASQAIVQELQGQTGNDAAEES